MLCGGKQFLSVSLSYDTYLRLVPILCNTGTERVCLTSDTIMQVSRRTRHHVEVALLIKMGKNGVASVRIVWWMYSQLLNRSVVMLIFYLVFVFSVNLVCGLF